MRALGADALETVFEFLPVAALFRAMAVCREWRGARALSRRTR